MRASRAAAQGALVRPFIGLRAAPDRAAEVAAPPYDVLTSEEARRLANGNPWSFLHVSKPEIDLAPGTDPHASEVYAKAAENMRRFIEAGVLVRDSAPTYTVYRMTADGHVQTGLVAAGSVAAYEAGRIRRHEFTFPGKVEDRMRQIQAVDAYTGPVIVAHRAEAAAALLADIAAGPPEVDVTLHNGVRHALWVVSEAKWIDRLSGVFGALDALYLADGHHRTDAAVRIAAAAARANPTHRGDEPYNFFPAVCFPADEVRILDYNRLVRDLNGVAPAAFLDAIAQSFDVAASPGPARPSRPHEFGMYLAGGWHRLRPRGPLPPGSDPVACLDVSLLSERLLGPYLGIGDPRTDSRIDFVGGIRGLEELERRVDSGEMAVAFALYPTAMADLLAVADAGLVMPPKSTWFEPKLADGLIALPLG